MSVNPRHLRVFLDRIEVGRLIYVERDEETKRYTVRGHAGVRAYTNYLGVDFEEFQKVVKSSLMVYPDGTAAIMWGDVEDYYTGVRH